jgi:phosphoribosylformylglycinamidine synthase
MCTARRFPHVRIGVVADGAGAPALDVQELFTVPLAELRTAHEATLPAVLEGR